MLYFIRNIGEDLENNETDDNSSYKIAILSSCSVIACVVMVLIYFTGKETCFVPFIKNWTIQDSKKKKEKTHKKTAKIDKKKVAPQPSFHLKHEKSTVAEKLQTKVQNFFERKSHSDNILLRNSSRNREKNAKKLVKTTILRISSTKKLLLLENIGKSHEKISKLPSLAPEKSSLSRIYCENIPKEYIAGENEAEKLLEILVETQK